MRERELGFDDHVSEANPGYSSRRSSSALQESWEDDHLIYSYSRAQALAAGVLVDVSKLAKIAGFKYPTTITADLHACLTPNEREKAMGQSYEGRLWDVFHMSILAGRKSTYNRLIVDVLLAERNGSGQLVHQKIQLWAVIGPGDDASPVVTIGLPEDF